MRSCDSGHGFDHMQSIFKIIAELDQAKGIGCHADWINACWLLAFCYRAEVLSLKTLITVLQAHSCTRLNESKIDQHTYFARGSDKKCFSVIVRYVGLRWVWGQHERSQGANLQSWWWLRSYASPGSYYISRRLFLNFWLLNEPETLQNTFTLVSGPE